MNENHCPFSFSKTSSYYSYIIFVFHYKSDQIFRDFSSNTPELSNPLTERRYYQEEDDAADELEQLLEEEEEKREEKVDGLCSCCLLSLSQINYTFQK